MLKTTSGEIATVAAGFTAVYVHDEAADLLTNYKAIPSLLIRLMVRDLIATLAAKDRATDDASV